MPGRFPLLNIAKVVAIAVLTFTSAANAQTATDGLGQCLILNSTGADRLALMKWMAFAIAAHPAVRDKMAVPASEIDSSDRSVAALFTKLLVVECPDEARAVFAGGNSQKAIEVAFEQLGKMAAQEIFSNPELEVRMQGFIKYLNEADFKSLGLK